MTNIDRRRFVSAIGAMAACTAAAPAMGDTDAGSQPIKTRFNDEKDLDWSWCIARQKLDHRLATTGVLQHVVDFWSKPLSTISLADYLPSEISRGVLWFDGFSPDNTLGERLKYIDSVHTKHSFAWIEEPRSATACLNDPERLSSALQSLCTDDRSVRVQLRTALLDLDSTSPAGDPRDVG
jgi:hypothetical protein